LHIVALIDNLDINRLAGAETSAYLACRELARLGHRVSIITAGPFNTAGVDSNIDDDIAIYTIPARPAGVLADYMLVSRPHVVRATIDIVQHLQPDIIQSHVIHNYFSFGVLKAMKGVLPTVPIVATLHDYSALCRGALICKSQHLAEMGTLTDFRMPGIGTCWLCQKYTFNPLKRRQLLNILNSYCDIAVFVSDALRTFYVSNGLTIRTEVIYNGTIPIYDTLPPEIAQQFMQSHRLEGFQIVICGGRMKHSKGYHTVVDALPQIIQRAVKPPLLVVYGGKNDYSRSVENKAREIGVADHLRMVDWLSKDSLRTLIAIASVGVVPSIYADPLPRAIYEYMGQGLPVVATVFGGAKEVIRDGKNGFLVNPKHLDDVATKIVQLLNSPQLCDEIRKQALATVETSFLVSIAARKRVEIYTHLMDEIP